MFTTIRPVDTFQFCLDARLQSRRSSDLVSIRTDNVTSQCYLKWSHSIELFINIFFIPPFIPRVIKAEYVGGQFLVSYGVVSKLNFQVPQGPRQRSLNGSVPLLEFEHRCRSQRSARCNSSSANYQWSTWIFWPKFQIITTWIDPRSDVR